MKKSAFEFRELLIKEANNIGDDIAPQWVVNNLKVISNILSMFPQHIRERICIHHFYFGNYKHPLYHARTDLRVTKNETPYGRTIEWPHQCFLCGHLISCLKGTNHNGVRIYGPREDYPIEFKKCYSEYTNKLNFNPNEAGSWFSCEFPNIAYSIWREHGENAMKEYVFTQLGQR